MNPMDKNQYVVTTGGTGGLGRVVVRRLLKKRHHVLDITYGSRPEVVRELTCLAASAGCTYTHFQRDLKSEQCTDATFFAFLDQFPAIQHLVLMHGTLHNSDPLALNKKMLLESMQINFLSHFFLAQKLITRWKHHAAQMSNSDHSITFVSSVSTKTGSAAELPYHAAKRSMCAAILSFAREYASLGIRANAISPGLMAVGMGLEAVRKRPSILKRIPLGIPVDPEEVAKLIYLVMTAEGVTGQDFDINAGRTLQV